MIELRSGGLRAVSGDLQQSGVVIFGLGSISRRFGRLARIEQTIETIRAQGEGLLVLAQRVLRTPKFQQDIRQHFARGYIDLALSHFVLYIRRLSHLLES